MQSSTQGPSIASVLSLAGSETGAWSSTSNVLTNDGSRALCSVDYGQYSEYLAVTGFGFSIPASATISGIELAVSRAQSNSGSYNHDNSIKIIKGGSVAGNEMADTSTLYPGNSTPTYAYYGSSTELWGLTWMPSDVNSSGFGGAISCYATAGQDGSQIYYMSLTVYYTLPPSKLTGVQSITGLQSITF